MRNIKATVSADKSKLTLVLDLAGGGAPSKSGKTNVVCSSEGRTSIDGLPGKLNITYDIPNATP